MPESFDLVFEPWIPCIMATGETIELGLLETLTRAPDILEVYDPSPTVTAALHRLLLAILHRNFGPKNVQEWEDMWALGRWDEGVLASYFERWRDRFDLFHHERPFYQAPGLPHKPVAATVLAPEMAHGNNPTLFDHACDDAPRAFSPASAARLLVACQAFHLGGLISRVQGEPPSAPAAPLAGGAVILFQGDDLFRTLMLNLIPYDGSQQPWSGQKDDAPAWELDGADYRPRAPAGYLDYLTWQSRRIWLLPEREDGRIVVRAVAIASGRHFPRGYFLVDPQFAYRKNPAKNPRPGDPPWRPLRFSLGRALWRDSTALLAAETDSERPPRARDWLSELTARRKLDRSARHRVAVLGLCSDRAKVHFWRREWMPVPASYLVDKELVGNLQRMLQLSEDVGASLQAALRALVGAAVEVGPGRQRESRGETILVAGESRYWGSLEVPFYELLEGLPNNAHSAMSRWARILVDEALDAYDQALRGLDESVRFLRDAVRIRAELEGRLWVYCKPFEEVASG